MQYEEHVALLDQLVPDPDGQRRDVYRIGDLAREFDVTLRTLRFYEDRGLIHPAREGSTRLYSARDRQRLKIILLAKQVGFPLTEIQEIMHIYDTGGNGHNPLESVLSKFRAQLDVLKLQKSEIEAAINKLNETIDSLESKLPK
jgi:DNA-binding transcriptional MerR regulator